MLIKELSALLRQYNPEDEVIVYNETLDALLEIKMTHSGRFDKEYREFYRPEGCEMSSAERQEFERNYPRKLVLTTNL